MQRLVGVTLLLVVENMGFSTKVFITVYSLLLLSFGTIELSVVELS